MTQEFDVIIVGAGLSGIGTAYRLQRDCPAQSFHILEGRQSIGGTWDLFRYPGIRSDSDMHSMSYDFKPWLGGKVLADGPSIRDYVQETAEENRIIEHIGFNKTVTQASWSSARQRWTLTTESDSGAKEHYYCTLLLLCSGYYSYKQAHVPAFPGREAYQGVFVEPQFWPENLDHANKSVVVIGSGATAATIVPAIAETASKVTMLQRSPTYFLNRPLLEPWQKLFDVFFSKQISYKLVRWKNTNLQHVFYSLTRKFPRLAKWYFLRQVKRELPPGYDVKTHFTPSYAPWDQRLCAVPDNDFFKAINAGTVDVVTDEIECFSHEGLRLKSGQQLAADIIVSATGLQLVVNGEILFFKDEEKIDFAKTWSYKGAMYSGVPNLISTFGYINASWTLRADLIAQFSCRLLNEMQRKRSRQVTPQLRASDAGMQAQPWINDFSSNYMQRSLHLFPMQGDREPWLNTQNYLLEKKTVGKANLNDGVLQFS